MAKNTGAAGQIMNLLTMNMRTMQATFATASESNKALVVTSRLYSLLVNHSTSDVAEVLLYVTIVV